ncbi:TIGR01906 family membrane protein [Paeniglutamicibacter gangotriensis]|uniref:Putative membrane protein n=1 Tax=Paeniglutamicibacter gangotriensis Lz1y TaxID=1276920 RepID=M7NLJ8_9MICC|nr:TIGR01906 family membrane protein [Paeniglutamicibacter gangotriensis]EMQ99403.1 putative membrane protein [Paeniglutamicibacter gangotriensis Lz1y]
MAEQDKVQTGAPDAPASAPTAPAAKAGAKPAEGSLSAAAEAAAAKIEASLAASRAAAAAKHSAPAAPAASPAKPEEATAATPAAVQPAEAKPATATTPAAATKPTEAKPAEATTPAAATKPAAAKAPAPAKAPAAKPDATKTPAAAKSAPATTPAAATKPAATKPAAAKAPAPAMAPAAKPSATKTPAASPAKPAAKPVKDESEEIEDIIAQIPVEPLPQTTKVSVTEAPAAAAPDATAAMQRPAATAPGAGTPPQTASAIAEARSRVFGAYTPVPEPTPAARERRAAREAALEAKPPLARTLQLLLAIAYPFLLLIAAIRLIASPIFLWAVYQRPGFPADGFGFSTADRMTYGSYGVDFLNNIADNRYLGELRDPNGDPLFLGTEVQHMADVKNVMSFTYLGGVILAVIVIIALAHLGKRYAGGIRRGLFAGSVATVVLLAGLTTLAILGWETFFTKFHEIFFSQGNWTFNYSDTLIRLYPPQFWVDAAIAIGALVLITSLLTLLFTWPTRKRREVARLRQEKRVFGL